MRRVGGWFWEKPFCKCGSECYVANQGSQDETACVRLCRSKLHGDGIAEAIRTPPKDLKRCGGRGQLIPRRPLAVVRRRVGGYYGSGGRGQLIPRRPLAVVRRRVGGYYGSGGRGQLIPRRPLAVVRRRVGGYYGRGRGSASGAGFLIEVAAEGISAAIPTSRPTSIKIPCVSLNGAIQDYVYVVGGYKNFGGRGCYLALPPQLRSLHEQYVADIVKTVDANFPAAVNANSISRYLTRPSTVWLPCVKKVPSAPHDPATDDLYYCVVRDEDTALQDYKSVVLDYENYSGWGCWTYLPSILRKKHMNYVKQAKELLLYLFPPFQIPPTP